MIITRNLPPLVGGMEKLNWHLVSALAENGPVHVIGPGGCARTMPSGVTCDELRIRPLWRFLLLSLWYTVRRARRYRPKVIVAGSGLTSAAAWLAARLSGARAAIYVHGLDLIVPHPIYRWLWLPCIRRCDTVIANSRHTATLAVAAGVPDSRIQIVNPGTDVIDPDPRAGRVFRNRHGLGDRPLLLSVGRLTERKGLAEFVQQALPAIVAKHPGCCLLVIGDDASHALVGNTGAKQALLDAISRNSLDEHVMLFGTCDDTELASAYEAADVLVFPVREIRGDVEGFGMVALEAAAHGVPTVAFAVGGVPDAVAGDYSGILVSAGDYSSFIKSVVRILETGGKARWSDSCLGFASQLTWEAFAHRICQVFCSR